MGTATISLPLEAAPVAAAWSALDDQDAWQEFSRPLRSAEGRWESYIAVDGMHCAACTLVIEQALGELPGVAAVQVNGSAAIARIEWSPQQGRPSDWWRALERAGYRGLPAGDQLDARPRRREQRMLLWRWLVAGFCMMQVMMYAFPAYIAPPGEITPDIQALLRWACWMMTLPVVLFSCRPFFASALRDISHGRAGMDVPVALGILIAFGASTVATLDPGGPLGAEVWYDSVTMFVFFLLSGRLLENRLRGRTAGALEALARRLPAQVERRRQDGSFEQVAARRLHPGDVIRVRPGDAIPADGQVLEGRSQVDEALLTGESHPVPRGPDDAVIAGSHNLGSVLLVRVLRVGDDTRFAAIVALMERASVDKPRLALLADRIAGPFLLAVMVAAALAGWWWWPTGAGHALGIAVAVLIVTCPCALSLATPSATLAAAGALARRGIVLRRLEALESAAAIDTIIFDKTGTLTQDRIVVTGIRSRDDVPVDAALRLAAALARQSLHPASRAIAEQAGEGGPAAREVREEPGQGLEGLVITDGPPRLLRLGSAAWCAVPTDGGDTLQCHLADADGWLATFTLAEQLRPDALATVQSLQRAGLRVRLLSGDSTAAVQALAARAGIDAAAGAQSPQDKLDQLVREQQAGRRVAMVGDGLNDGPVIARADLSFAMGQGAPLAQARADIVVPGGQVEAVAVVLALARRTRRVVRQNLAWAAVYNAVCVPLALVGWMPPWAAGLGMACSSLVVVLNASRLSRLPGSPVIPAKAGIQCFPVGTSNIGSTGSPPSRG